MNRQRPVLPRPSASPGSTDFVWATGIEDTFISQPNPRTGRIMDEYALTQHYDHWQEDLSLIAALGVPAARYGIPWYRVEPQPGTFDWSWTDQVLPALVNQYGVEPIVDLMHYGTPAWLEGSFLSSEYPDRVAEYARAFAAHYKGLCYWYTPLNEPRVNAWYAARLGWWPPYRRTWSDFAAVLVALSRGIVETQRAVAEIEPQAVFVHVDATDLYKTADASLVEEQTLRQELVFCALDLVQGRVDETHPLSGWLRKHSISVESLEWFRRHPVQPDIIGYNMYPMFSEKHVLRAANGGVEVKIKPCWVETFTELTRMYARRYGLPVMCTETASTGLPSKRIRWIEDSVESVYRLRAEGVPVVGYTYWPLFSLVAWPYQRGKLPFEEYLIHMGLWDLREDPEHPGNLRRVRTKTVDAYKQVVASPVPPLASSA
ncbi:MAG TPA: family 1 glycosylhydrolase [Chthonomonadaceae bacterium]|nr:family 1 glycosylhydrolase [Chthonomonadaceae bacterium]